MVVDAFELGGYYPDPSCARRHFASCSVFHCLREGKRVRNATDTGDAFSRDDAAHGVLRLELFLHSAMLEKQIGLVMQNAFADVIENKLGRFQHVRADWTKWQ